MKKFCAFICITFQLYEMNNICYSLLVFCDITYGIDETELIKIRY